jgi:hypothetical protein
MAIAAPGKGQALTFVFFLGTADATESTLRLDPSTFHFIHRLPRINGVVLILGIAHPVDDGWLTGLTEAMSKSQWWSPPENTQHDERFGGFFVERPELGCHGVMEVATDRRPSLEGRDLPGFEGRTLDWAEMPLSPPSGFQACAGLECQKGVPPKLYVDRRARCNHAALAAEAVRLSKRYEERGSDSRWNVIGTDRHITFLVTPVPHDHKLNN